MSVEKDPCPDDNVLAEFVEHRLEGGALNAVETHLDQCSRCLALTCDLARGEEDTLAESDMSEGHTRPSPAERQPDALLGRYRLLTLVGQGAMGLVYAARDTHLDRKVALKVLRSERLSQPEARSRLLREARAMAKLSHPNVVTVYDAGQVGDRTFIAMEFVEGVTLGAWLRGQPWREALRVMLAAGRGLAAAHAAGIVHRDFKPENVLIDQSGRVAVTDFGLAAIPDIAPASEHSRPSPAERLPISVTRTGTLLGTPRYMSPEQHSGLKVDARTDQFAFSVALHEALYAQRAFAGTTLEELRDEAAIGRVQDAPPNTDVPESMRRVLLRGLSPHAGDRYPTLDAMLEELEVVLLGESHRSEARQVAPQRRRVPRASLWAAGFAAIAAVVLAGYSRLPSRKLVAAPAPSSAASAVVPAPGSGTQVLVMGFENRTMDPVFDGTLDLVLESALTRSPTLYPLAGSSLRALVMSTAPNAGGNDEQLGREIAERTHRPVVLVRGAVVPDGAAFSLSLEASDGAHVHLFSSTLRADGSSQVVPTMARLACDLRAAIHDAPCDEASKRETGLSANVEADHAFSLGRGASNAGQFGDALPALERAVELDPDFAMAHHSLGLLLWNLGRSSEGEPHLRLALGRQSGLSDRQRLAIGAGYHILMDEYDLAARSYEKLLSRWPADTRYRGNLAGVYLQAGDIDRGIATAKQAASENSKSAVIRANLPMALAIGGALEDAEREGQRTLSDLPHPLPLAYVALAVVEALLGHRDATLDLHRRLEAADASIAAASKADFALFEGRLTDAVSLLEAGIAQDNAKKSAAAAEAKWAMLAETHLRRGDSVAARRAALRATESHELVTLTRAARVLATVGSADPALEHRIREHPGQRAPVFARLVEISDHRTRRADRGEPDGQGAIVGSGAWLVHAERGASYFEAGALEPARQELEGCLAHLGEGGMAFVDDTATLRYIPQVRYLYARTLDALHRPTAAAALATFLSTEHDAQNDPLLDDARRRSSVR